VMDDPSELFRTATLLGNSQLVSKRGVGNRDAWSESMQRAHKPPARYQRSRPAAMDVSQDSGTDIDDYEDERYEPESPPMSTPSRQPAQRLPSRSEKLPYESPNMKWDRMLSHRAMSPISSSRQTPSRHPSAYGNSPYTFHPSL
jgi:hypothetical protein